jgi:hypothetical protein
VLNKESRRDWCLEDDLLSTDYPFFDPRFLELAEKHHYVPLLRICIAQMEMSLKVMQADFDNDQTVSARVTKSFSLTLGRTNDPYNSTRNLRLAC